MNLDATITAQHLSKFTSIASPLVAEASIDMLDNGLLLEAVDPAAVAQVRTMLGEGAFDEYETSGGTMGVNLSRLSDGVSLADKDAPVSLSLDTGPRLLLFSNGLEFRMGLIDPDSIRQAGDLPDLDLPVSVTIAGNKLSRAIRAADMMESCETVQFRSDPDAPTFIIAAEGDTDEMHEEFTGDDLLDATIPETAASLFSLDYLKDVIKPIDNETEVTLNIGTEFPVEIQYRHADDSMTTTVLVAPRIEAE